MFSKQEEMDELDWLQLTKHVGTRFDNQPVLYVLFSGTKTMSRIYASPYLN
jgi:hypothetical protein